MDVTKQENMLLFVCTETNYQSNPVILPNYDECSAT